MLKVKYEGLEFELDIISLFVSAASHLTMFKRSDLLSRIRDPVTLVSSNLYAIREGTRLSTPSGVFHAAPLLKPKPDGTAVSIRSGYPVTGVYDVLGQVEIVHRLGGLKLSFNISYDMNPDLDRYENWYVLEVLPQIFYQVKYSIDWVQYWVNILLGVKDIIRSLFKEKLSGLVTKV